MGAERRASKLVSLVASCFTGNYVRLWTSAMGPDHPLQSTPLFDGRAVLYPSDRHLRHYLSWRQADTHVNNQVPCPLPHVLSEGQSALSTHLTVGNLRSVIFSAAP